MLNLLLDAMSMEPILAILSFPAILLVIFVFSLCVSFLVMLIVFSAKKNKKTKLNSNIIQEQNNTETKEDN
jgi:uncharacterized membrane protein YvlD (DUF360 family)